MMEYSGTNNEEARAALIQQATETAPGAAGKPPLEEISEEVLQTISSRMRLRAIYELRDGTMMEILPHQDGRSMATAQKHHDRTVSLRLGEETQDIDVWDITQDALRRFLKEWSKKTHRRLQTVLRKLDPERRTRVRALIEERYGKRRPSDDLNQEALVKRITMRATLRAVGLPDEDSCEMYRVIEEAETLMNEKIILGETSNKVFNNLGWITFKHDRFVEKQYNAMIDHGNIIVEAARTRPTVARVWWHHMTLLEKGTPQPGSVEEMEKMTRQEMGIKPEEWEAMERLTTSESRESWDHLLPPQTSIERLVCGTRALASIERGGTCDNYLMHIFQHDQEHLIFHQAEWSEGNAWKSWLWIIQEAVADHNRECGKAGQESLEEDPLGGVAEALAHHVENQLPWSNRPWEELVLRSRHRINEQQVQPSHLRSR